MNNSEARSKSKVRRRWPYVAVAAVLALIYLAPQLALYLVLSALGRSAAENGLELSWQKARAGFMLSRAEVEGLRAASSGGPALIFTAETLRLENPSIKTFLSLSRDPLAWRPQRAPLADSLALKGLALEGGGLSAQLNNFSLTAPALAPGPADIPVVFESLAADLFTARYIDGDTVEMSRLTARALGPEKLGSLALESFTAAWDDRSTRLEMGGLSAGGLNLAGLGRLLSGRGEPATFLMSCDWLDAAFGSFSRNGTEIWGLRRAIFDANDIGGTTRYRRAVDFHLNPRAMADYRPYLADEPLFQALMEAQGPEGLNLAVDLTLDHTPLGGAAEIVKAQAASPELGQISLAGKIDGVEGVRAGFTPYQMLFTAAAWRLYGFSAVYEDRGFMASLYRALEKAGRGGARGLMEEYINPLIAVAEEEEGLANLSAVVSEIEAFLGQPQSMAVVSAPESPVALLSLAKGDKYDIIDKLNLSVQVNRRAPVAVRAARGVNFQELPSSPKSLETFFDEEDI